MLSNKFLSKNFVQPIICSTFANWIFHELKSTLMNISKEQIDALNAVITLEIDKSDYQKKVDEATYPYGND